ncbi:MAG: hypothetical protein MZU97_06520 [Bacillus subtilis]|nr:hypothetical protein [Bacillus subtilis]
MTVAETPAAESFLFGLAAATDILTVYVGELEMILDGTFSMSSIILIVTTSGGVDVCRWIINTYAWYGTDHEMWQFASYLLIDPLVGVHKDMSIVSQTRR